MTTRTTKKKPPPKKAKPKPKRNPVKAKVSKKKAGKKTKKKVTKKKTKRKPKRNPVKKVKTSVEVPIVLDNVPDKKGLGYIRWMAGQYYATSLNQCSLVDMAEHPMFSAVHKSTLGTWSVNDKWTLRRQEFQDRIRSKVQNVIATELVKYRTKQLENLQSLFDKSLDKILKAVDKLSLDADNLPSYIRAITQLGDLLDKWRSSLGEVIAPSMSFESDDGTQVASLPMKPQLTEGESRAAAKLLIKMRREAMQRKMEEAAAAKDKEESDIMDKPALRVVEGER